MYKYKYLKYKNKYLNLKIMIGGGGDEEGEGEEGDEGEEDEEEQIYKTNPILEPLKDYMPDIEGLRYLSVNPTLLNKSIVEYVCTHIDDVDIMDKLDKFNKFPELQELLKYNPDIKTLEYLKLKIEYLPFIKDLFENEGHIESENISNTLNNIDLYLENMELLSLIKYNPNREILEYLILYKYNLNYLIYIKYINKALLENAVEEYKSLDDLFKEITIAIQEPLISDIFEKEFITYAIKYITDQAYAPFLTRRIYTITSEASLYNDKTFEIDLKLKTSWIDKQCYHDAKILGDFIIKITRHVSFSEFQETLLKSIHKIPIKRQYVIIIPVEGDTQKSNIWISSILIDKIQTLGLQIDIVDIIYYKADKEIDAFNTIIIKVYGINYIDFIICDDGSYSGGQMEENIINILTCLDMYDIFTSSRIYCLIPYISTHAFRILNTISEKVVLLNSDIIETVKERAIRLKCTELVLDGSTLNLKQESGIRYLKDSLNTYFPNLREKTSYNLATGSMPFYFDHKIADYVSSFPVIYQYGYIQENEPLCKGGNQLLFTNCDNIPTLDALDMKTYDEQCVVPYYKKLNIKITEKDRLPK